MRVAIGHSTDPSIAHSMREILVQLHQQLDGHLPQAAIVYAGINTDHTSLLQSLAQAFPGMALIGCTTDGELSSLMDFQEDSIVVMAFCSDQVTFTAGIGHHVSAGPYQAAMEAVGMARGPLTPRLCVTLPESLTVSGVSVVKALNQVLGADVILVGGTAGDQWAFQSTRQFFGTQVLQDSLPVLLISGNVQVSVGVASGWRPVGRRARITRSAANIVYEIDQMPALEFYKSYLGDHVDPTPEYPLGVFDEQTDQFYLRAPLMYDEGSGSITFAGDVPADMEVQITQAGRSDMLDACRKSVNNALQDFSYVGQIPSAALVFSCAARKQLLGTRTAEEVQVLKEHMQQPIPVVGFYSYGEIAPLGGAARADFHNETFVTVLMGAQ